MYITTKKPKKRTILIVSICAAIGAAAGIFLAVNSYMKPVALLNNKRKISNDYQRQDTRKVSVTPADDAVTVSEEELSNTEKESLRLQRIAPDKPVPRVLTQRAIQPFQLPSSDVSSTLNTLNEIKKINRQNQVNK